MLNQNERPAGGPLCRGEICWKWPMITSSFPQVSAALGWAFALLSVSVSGGKTYFIVKLTRVLIEEEQLLLIGWGHSHALWEMTIYSESFFSVLIYSACVHSVFSLPGGNGCGRGIQNLSLVLNAFNGLVAAFTSLLKIIVNTYWTFTLPGIWLSTLSGLCHLFCSRKPLMLMLLLSSISIWDTKRLYSGFQSNRAK